MGNTTRSEHPQNRELHQRLGQVILSDVTDQQGNVYELMTLTKVVETESEFNRWYKDMSKIDDSVTRQVLLLSSKTVFQSTGFCGSSGVVHLTYDHFPYVFQVEVQNRRKINRFFLQTQLWYLLYNMIRAGSKFEKYHAKIGDVHPSNILINNDGLVKLISTCSFPRECNNFQKLVDNPNARVFLAPEQLDQNSTHTGDYPKNIDPSTAQCYSIGLCLLAAGTLEDVDSIYIIQLGQRKILKHKLNLYLKQFGEKYSSFLHSLLMGLLVDSPFERKKCSEIYSTLYEYEQRILDLQSFLPANSRMINYVQQPLQQSVSNIPRQMVQSNLIYQPQIQPVSRANVTNIYYHPSNNNNNNNPVMVNPIQSLYVPVNQIHFRPPAGYQSNGGFPMQSSKMQTFPNSANISAYNGQR